jgi:hypothetical protein
VIAVALVVTIIGSNMIRKPAPSNQAPTPAQVR